MDGLCTFVFPIGNSHAVAHERSKNNVFKHESVTVDRGYTIIHHITHTYMIGSRCPMSPAEVPFDSCRAPAGHSSAHFATPAATFVSASLPTAPRASQAKDSVWETRMPHRQPHH